MRDVLERFLLPEQFMPHGHCFLWTPSILWLSVIADGITAAAYFSIPFALLYVVRRRRDLVFKPVFVMFGVFILACALTHVLDIVTIWVPSYYLLAAAKALTAAASLGTALALWPLVPRVLSLPSAAELAAANTAMQNEIAARRAAQAELEHSMQVLERSAAALEFQTTHDTITGLANRTLLCHDIDHATSQRRGGGVLAVAFIDLDHFRFVNDGLGHAVGDEVLRIVAGRIGACIREGDTLARLGGDEFGLVLTEPARVHVVAALMQRIQRAVREDIQVGPHQVSLSCSIGVSLHPHDGASAEALLTQADVAMHRAKEFGRNNVQFFERTMNARVEERLLFENRLRHALERHEFHLCYQPQVDARSGEIAGVEALLRWTHPALGAVSPVKFIPLAEELGLIGEIGHWVLRTACRQNAAWIAAGMAPVTMAVNVSTRQFQARDFVPSVLAVLAETGLPPAYLELELTEGLLIEDPAWASQVLAELRAAGIALSVDDFGTGYSSLSYLQRLPLSSLKVDKSFIHAIRAGHDAVIARSIIGLGHNLGLTVVAEGVETLDQLRAIQLLGCDRIQGYYFSEPLPAAQATTFLRARAGCARMADAAMAEPG